MREITTRQAREDFSDEVNRVAFGGERLVLTRRGKKLAALVPVADLAQLEAAPRLTEQRDDLLAALRRCIREAPASGMVEALAQARVAVAIAEAS